MEIVGVLVHDWVDGERVQNDSLTKVWGIGSSRDVSIVEAEQYFVSLLNKHDLDSAIVEHYLEQGSYYCTKAGRRYLFINCKLEGITS